MYVIFFFWLLWCVEKLPYVGTNTRNVVRMTNSREILSMSLQDYNPQSFEMGSRDPECLSSPPIVGNVHACSSSVWVRQTLMFSGKEGRRFGFLITSTVGVKGAWGCLQVASVIFLFSLILAVFNWLSELVCLSCGGRFPSFLSFFYISQLKSSKYILVTYPHGQWICKINIYILIKQ